MQDTLTISNIGPIQALNITVPKEGGVVVLRGSNGTGKSTALKATEALLRGKGELETRDGFAGSGRVSGLGATLNIGRRVTRAGEIEIQSIEGRLDISELVSPPIKDVAAADRQRVKALISLTGVEPTADLFRSVLGDDLMPFVSAATWLQKDFLELASKAKRDLEANARLKENEAALYEGSAKACEESAAGIDLKVEHDERVLRDAHSAAVAAEARLNERCQAALAAEQKAQAAQARLEKLTTGYTGPSVAEAMEEMGNREGKYQEAFAADKRIERQWQEKIKQMEHELELARQRAKSEVGAAVECTISAFKAKDDAVRQYNAAVAHEQTIAECKSLLESTKVEMPDDAEVAAAVAASENASKAVAQGAVIRRAKAELEKAKGHRAQAEQSADIASRLRNAAGLIDNVLSQAVKVPQLFVRDGRLLTTTARGETYYSELSEGERWRLAFDVAAQALGENGILVLPQAAWEAEDPMNRAHIAKLALERKLIVLTAEATDGALRAEQFGK